MQGGICLRKFILVFIAQCSGGIFSLEIKIRKVCGIKFYSQNFYLTMCFHFQKSFQKAVLTHDKKRTETRLK
jgi:hypothetical protein